MNNFWRWFFGIVVGVLLVAWLLVGRSDRQAYRIARGAIEQRTENTQARIEAAVESATASVDLALQLAGNLPSQQAEADLIKADIEEIGNRLNDAAEARGEAAIAALDQSIEQFNTTLETVEDASNQAQDPQVKATLERIYDTLSAGKEQLTQAVLRTQQ
jgi:biopolymer transport protein ExbB/TolQ